jgi:hypothetical protein
VKTFTRTIRNAAEAQQLNRWLGNASQFPFTITVAPGKEKRSSQQNRLQFQWVNDAANQGDQTQEEYRAYCKLHYGVPILRNEDEHFRAQYDAIIRPLSYEQKLALMSPPIDFPVTSLMTVKQKTQYLNQMWQHFTGLGFQLTDPAMLGMEGWREAQ